MLREPLIYLVATAEGKEGVRQFALHRFEAVEVLDAARREPAGFELDAYIAAGHFGWREGEPIALELRLGQGVAEHLREAPLAADQRLGEHIDAHGRLGLRATVPDTQQLRW